jgi:hypothetical protein
MIAAGACGRATNVETRPDDRAALRLLKETRLP